MGETFLFNQIIGSSDVSNILSENHLCDIDKVAVEIHLSSLPHIVWLCLQYYSVDIDVQPSYNFIPLETSSFKTRYLPQALDDKLSHLDMFVFLLSSVRCASGVIWSRNNTFPENESHCPILLPVIINPQFCTKLQEQWWSAAYKFCTQTDKDVASFVWPVLKQGVETVRLAGSHGMSLMMSAHIAKCLDAKVKNMVEIGLNGNYSTSDLIALEEKAAFFWMQTKQTLKNIHIDRPLDNQRFFVETGDENIPINLLASIAEEANFAMACINLNSNQLMAALQTFTSLHSLWAKYFMAKIYRKLAQFEDKTAVNVQMTLLLKAKHCLKDVMENNHKNNCFKLEVLSSRDLVDLNAEINKLCEGGSKSTICPLNNYSFVNQDLVIPPTSAFPFLGPNQYTIKDKSPRKSESHVESLMVKILLENNYSLIQHTGKLIEEHHQMKHELKEKDFCMEKLKTELMATSLLHSLQ
ncbi:hypothetical protein Btru_074353 [Bulinus truncatus]|nr:hypothetical protein Btru_074353 [Bulinus truncatus]